MPEVKRIALAKVLHDALNPREECTELQALSLSMKEHGQHEPILVYKMGEQFQLIDGARRCHALKLAGAMEVDARILEEKPTDAAIRIMQMNIDFFKSGLSAMERSNLLQRILNETKWSITEISRHLHIKQPLVSKLIAYQNAHPDVQAALHAGRICMERAYVIAQMPDAGTQLELLKQAGNLSREQLRRKAHSNGQPIELKASKGTFLLPTGVTVIVRGQQMTLSGAIDALYDAMKELKKGQSQGLDITTQQRVMTDRAKKHQSTLTI